MKSVECWYDKVHRGPFHWYLWRQGRREHQQILCEKCAKSVGAWILPEKKEEVKHEPTK
jgi:hypothetical protein